MSCDFELDYQDGDVLYFVSGRVERFETGVDPSGYPTGYDEVWTVEAVSVLANTDQPVELGARERDAFWRAHGPAVRQEVEDQWCDAYEAQEAGW